MESFDALPKNGAGAPFFTVIIPMYNVGSLVAECLRSVYMQDIAEEDYEIIIVDDCSTDSSRDHLADATRHHTNTIIVSHKENRRPGGARNTALRIAKGRYVLFLDADDYWQYTNTLSTFKKIIDTTDADVIDSDVNRNVHYASALSPQTYDVPVGHTAITGSELLRRHDFNLGPCYAAYRRETILRHDVWFAECVQYEDVDWRMRMIYRAGSIVRISFPFYCYRKNPKSILNSPSPKLLHDAVKCYKRLYTFASADISEDMREYLCSWILKNVTSFPMLSRIYPIHESRKAIATMKETGLLSRSSYT
ncbi:MAG: glycosyltransferase family 2 protein, partial [Prevotella sp.]